jgi:UrcA family protein
MKNYTARIAGLATLALAALPIAALSTAAHAQAGRIQVADLNLASASGKATFERRADAVATHFCRAEHNLTQRSACQAGIRREADDKLAAGVQFASRN